MLMFAIQSPVRESYGKAQMRSGYRDVIANCSLREVDSIKKWGMYGLTSQTRSCSRNLHHFLPKLILERFVQPSYPCVRCRVLSVSYPHEFPQHTYDTHVGFKPTIPTLIEVIWNSIPRTPSRTKGLKVSYLRHPHFLRVFEMPYQ